MFEPGFVSAETLALVLLAKQYAGQRKVRPGDFKHTQRLLGSLWPDTTGAIATSSALPPNRPYLITHISCKRYTAAPIGTVDPATYYGLNGSTLLQVGYVSDVFAIPTANRIFLTSQTSDATLLNAPCMILVPAGQGPGAGVTIDQYAPTNPPPGVAEFFFGVDYVTHGYSIPPDYFNLFYEYISDLRDGA